MPLGATVGPAGLAVMPYTLTFTGNFFHVADFIKGLDSLVKTQNEKVAVDGRLLTVNGFSLAGGAEGGIPDPGGDLLGHHLPDPARPGPRPPAPRRQARHATERRRPRRRPEVAR